MERFCEMAGLSPTNERYWPDNRGHRYLCSRRLTGPLPAHAVNCQYTSVTCVAHKDSIFIQEGVICSMPNNQIYPDHICSFCHNLRSVRVGPPENDSEPSSWCKCPECPPGLAKNYPWEVSLLDGQLEAWTHLDGGPGSPPKFRLVPPQPRQRTTSNSTMIIRGRQKRANVS